MIAILTIITIFYIIPQLLCLFKTSWNIKDWKISVDSMFHDKFFGYFGFNIRGFDYRKYDDGVITIELGQFYISHYPKQ